MSDPEAYPRVLASFRGADSDNWPGEVAALEAAGIDGIHLDVMDGRFVPSSCFEARDVEVLRRAGARFVDVHLLVESPGSVAPAYLAAGADRLSFHLECASDPVALCARIRAAGCTPAVALLPRTPVESVVPLLPLLGMVNPLGVDPTVGGAFDEGTYARIADLREMRAVGGYEFTIQGDGGVWERTRDRFVESGADELVGGYPIFSSDDYAAAIRALREGSPDDRPTERRE